MASWFLSVLFRLVRNFPSPPNCTIFFPKDSRARPFPSSRRRYGVSYSLNLTPKSPHTPKTWSQGCVSKHVKIITPPNPTIATAAAQQPPLPNRSNTKDQNKLDSETTKQIKIKIWSLRRYLKSVYEGAEDEVKDNDNWTSGELSESCLKVKDQHL